MSQVEVKMVNYKIQGILFLIKNNYPVLNQVIRLELLWYKLLNKSSYFFLDLLR